jgi:hypothetical protein
MAQGAIDEAASLDSVLNRIQLPPLDGRGLLVGGVRVPFVSRQSRSPIPSFTGAQHVSRVTQQARARQEAGAEVAQQGGIAPSGSSSRSSQRSGISGSSGGAPSRRPAPEATNKRALPGEAAQSSGKAQSGNGSGANAAESAEQSSRRTKAKKSDNA